MGTVKLNKTKILKFLVLITALFFGYNNTYAAGEVQLKFTDTKITETVSGSGYKIAGTDLTISEAGTYRITGSSVNGSITVKKGTTGVNLIFDNLSLTSTKTAPLTINKDGAEVKLRLEGTNTLIDNEDPENEFSTDPIVLDLFEASAIKVKAKSSLTISGSGTLNVESINKNAIKGGKQSTIQINSGTINIISAKNGLSCDHKIIINGGVLNISALSEGIKLEPDADDSVSAAELTINGGTINAGTALNKIGEDGIQAVGNIYVNGKANINVYAENDAIQTRSNFYMTDGTLNLYAYQGWNATDFVKDVLSAKGIKAALSDDPVDGATNLISITGGTVNINSSDDSIHSDGDIIITKGTINVQSFDDGIHADSKLTIGENNGLERDPEINVLHSHEGIEAGNIYIYSGKIKINANDDGINAAGGASGGDGSQSGDHFNPLDGSDRFAVYAYGGTVYINSGTDGYDANGSLYLYGGTHIVFSQGAGGTNSALDRDAHLVIDGATVFTSGSIGTNGIITSIESNQKFVDQIYGYDAETLIAITDSGSIIYNDELPKDTEYIFYTSPTLTTNADITEVLILSDLYNNPWSHEWDSGNITTPATSQNPGVITYTSTNGHVENKTILYENDVIFNIFNRTNAGATVTIGNLSDKYDFTSSGSDTVKITSDVDIFLITSDDNGLTFNKETNFTKDGNLYTYTLDDTKNQNLYVIYKGDVNGLTQRPGYISAYDDLLIQKSMLDPSSISYRALSVFETLAADSNSDGIIDQNDIDYIHMAQLFMFLNYGYVQNQTSDVLTMSHNKEASVDGVNSDTVEVYIKAGNNIPFDAFEAMFIPNQYFTLVELTPMLSGGTIISELSNGMMYMVNTDGYSKSTDDTIYKAVFEVNPITPTGNYKLNLKVGVYTPHNESNYNDFNLVDTIHVDGVTTPHEANISIDEGVESIDIFYTKNYATPNETLTENIIAYSRNPDSGEYDISDDSQINFRVNLKDGYVISNITATPSENYNQIKGPGDTKEANTYRITKMVGDITITVTTKQAQEYTAVFTTDKNIKQIDYYYTKDYSSANETAVTYALARNGDTGEIDITGEGQINFKIIPKAGYRVKSVTVDGHYKNLKGKEDTGVDNLYRITKVSGDLVVNITSEKQTAITVDVTGYESSYEYTGKKIKPEVTIRQTGLITAADEEECTSLNGDWDALNSECLYKPLVKDQDYYVTYGANKELGVNGGSITITSSVLSNYTFGEQVIYFDIVPYTLHEENIIVPSSIAWTGEPLTPPVNVVVDGKNLLYGDDYTVTYANQDGDIGTNINITVQGIGNYTGLVENINVPILYKPYQNIVFDEPIINVKYGENFIEPVTIIEGDGAITYRSSNEDVATVNAFTGAVILNKKGTAIITAYAAETEDYARTEASYTLNVSPATLSIYNLVADDKVYDGTTAATISDMMFIGLINDQIITKDTDYTINANFDSSNVGENKDVSVEFTLSSDILNRYEMDNNIYHTNANITKADITSSDITLDSDTYTYTGEEIKPIETITVGTNTLIKDTDYTVSYENNINAGTGKVIITGIGNYKTSSPIVITFTINKATITPVISNINPVTFNNAQQRPDITVTYNSTTLVKDTDYTITYENNVNASDNAIVRIHPVSSSNYTFDSSTAYKAFTINPYIITDSDITLEYKYIKHDGLEKKPDVSITSNGVKLVEDIDYTISYSNNINVGTNATVTVTPISFNYVDQSNPYTVDVHFEITDKDVLEISGINDNQKITYTGEEVNLQGNIVVSQNSQGITKDNLIVKYYDENNNLVNKPINTGKYYVIYSYDDNGYIGEYKVSFEITKAKTPYPDEIEKTFYAVSGNELSTISFETSGLSWEDSTITITPGHNHYKAIYTKNNDSINYEPKEVLVNVYGKHKVNITTSVNGVGGSISDGFANVLEGTTKEITITPNTGFKVKSVTVNGEEVGIEDNKLSITVETSNIDVIVIFEAITYELNISGTNVTTDPLGIIKVNHNDSESVTITTKSGYRLTSALVNNTEKIDEVTNNKLEVNNITEDTNIVVKAKKVEYSVIEGAKQTYTINKDEAATFKVDAEYNLFTSDGKVYVDDKLVDSKNYTSKKGSIVITFNKDYLDTLDLGVHTLNIKLSDGGVAQTTFTIARETTRTIEKQVKEASTTLKTGTSKSYSSKTKTNTTTIDNNTNTDNTNIDDNKDTTTKDTAKKSSSNKASKNKQSKTNDNTAIYIILGVISLISILIIVLFKNDKKDDFID